MLSYKKAGQCTILWKEIIEINLDQKIIGNCNDKISSLSSNSRTRFENIEAPLTFIGLL